MRRVYGVEAITLASGSEGACDMASSKTSYGFQKEQHSIIRRECVNLPDLKLLAPVNDYLQKFVCSQTSLEPVESQEKPR